MGVHPFQWRTSHLHRPAVCPHPDVIYLVQVLQDCQWHRGARHWGAAAPVEHNALFCEGMYGWGDDRVRVPLQGGLGFGKQKKTSIGISAPSRAFKENSGIQFPASQPSGLHALRLWRQSSRRAGSVSNVLAAARSKPVRANMGGLGTTWRHESGTPDSCRWDQTSNGLDLSNAFSSGHRKCLAADLVPRPLPRGLAQSCLLF